MGKMRKVIIKIGIETHVSLMFLLYATINFSFSPFDFLYTSRVKTAAEEDKNA